MSARSRGHEWIVQSASAVGEPVDRIDTSDYRIDAHRGLRGPYSAAAALVRAVCARSNTDLVEPHLLTLLSIAPELKTDFSASAELAASFAFSREGNPRSWTLRIAHGIADFLLSSLLHPTSVLFFNVEHADPTDREFISVLLRRADPGQLFIKVSSGGHALPEPLAKALRLHAGRSCEPIVAAASSVVDDASAGPRAFVVAFGEAPVPGDGPQLMLTASNQCMRMAYYDAALEWASLGRSMVDRMVAPEEHGKLARNVLFALLLLDRYDEVEAFCIEALAHASDPGLLAHATYAMAMLNARFYDATRRDYDAAKGWIEQSLAFTDRLPVSEIRAVNHAFLMNTMALVEMRKGHDTAALDLLDAALAFMAKEAPGKYRLECGILLHNRARLHVAGKRIEDAMADLTALLAVEPSSSEAYFDRGLLQQRAGRFEGALQDYDSAIRWSPPYWEPHFNRAQVLTALDRKAAAIGDYDRVCVLHPDHLETLVSRGRLHLEGGDIDAADRDQADVLRLDGSNARALCLRGLVAIQRQEIDAAEQDLSAAIAADPRLADAWANRATIHFKRGELDAALGDIEHAVALREDADILYNHGRILEAQGRWDEAAARYRRLLDLAPHEAALVVRRLELCARRRPVAEEA